MIRVLPARLARPGPFTADVTSRGQTPLAALSPFQLGPVPVPGVGFARRMENAYQFSKVYPAHLRGEEILDTYHAWRAAGFASDRAIRAPMGRGARPAFTLLGEERLPYVAARTRAYFPWYRDAARHVPAFGQLQDLHVRAMRAGEPLTLVDFDGYDHHAVHGGHLGQVLRDESRIVGHGFVLAAMLTHGPLVTPADLG